MKTPLLFAKSMILLMLLVSSFHVVAQPVAEFDYWDMNLDSVFVTSKSQPDCHLDFRNTGDAPLIVSVTSSNPRFFILNHDSAFTILPGGWDGVCVDFNPLQPGEDTAVITITTNDPDHPVTTVQARGVGLAYPVTPDFLIDTLSTGEISHHQLVIKNTTFSRGQFYVLAESFFYMEVPYPSHFLEPEDSVVVDVNFNAHLYFSGSYPAWLEIFFYPEDYGYTKSVRLNTVMLIDDALPVIVAPDSLHVEIPQGSQKTESFTLGNPGEAELNYHINYNPMYSEAGGPRLYSTGFEEFETGPIHMKGGWYSAEYVFFQDEDRWIVDTANPYSGSQHLRFTSDNGDDYSRLFSPPIQAPEADVSAVDMMIDFEPGVTWTIVAASPSWGFSGNTLIIYPDGSLGVREEYWDSSVQSISGNLPAGYFNLKFSVNRTTNQFSIAVNNTVIYTGTSSTTSYSEISFSGGQEATGVSLDIDNIRFTEDDNIRFVTIFSEEGGAGSVPAGSSQEVTIRFDARNIDPGIYQDTLIVISSDTAGQVVTIPLTTVVRQNLMPVLTGVSDTTLVAGDILTLTFSATDPDDSLVSVEGFNIIGAPSNTQEVTASGNGFVTYTFTTEEIPTDSWYEGMIIARDPRDGISSLPIRIHVLAHKANDFALTNFKTGVDVAVFTDTVVVDIAHPDLNKLTIQFKPDLDYGMPPDGVKFILDGVQTNVDWVKPYYINSWLISNLSEGYHSLTAISFYGFDGDEYVIATRKTTIQVINSAAITDFDLVRADGSKIMDLENGSVIDIGQPGFGAINIVANTSINTLRSVRFVTGNITIRIDNRAPYAMRGNANGSDTVWPAQPGFYTITAIPYMMYYGWGPRGVPLTVSFQVIRSAAPASARAGQVEDEVVNQEVSSEDDEWSIYPVPVDTEVTIRLSEKISGEVALQILNAQGQSIYSQVGIADAFRSYNLSARELGMNQGIFFVVLQQNNGRRSVKKVIKK